MHGVGEQRGAAPHAPTRSSAQRSSRCEPHYSASSPTWTHAHCCMPPRSAGTGALWPATPLSGHGCCSRTPVSVPRCLSLPAAHALPLTPAVSSPSHPQRLAPPGVVFATLTTPQLLLGPLKCSQEASCPTAGPPPASRAQVTPLSLQFLAMLAQWCTQAHSLTLQNLKPRQRGKKESKEEYARSTR